ncbi:MAG: hypothetical protein LUD17_02590 [Bacteroidales bacterium]|nr:hypothetical protein [Bacteroidales bacterium]
MKLKSYLLLLAGAAMAFASCSDDKYTGVQEPAAIGSDTAIAFSGLRGNQSRAIDGKAAADSLGSEFVVEGFKTISEGSTTSSQLVFNDYHVQYNGNAGSTDSNTKGWEYVALDDYATQSIKYWDFDASSYTFVAYSLGNNKANLTATAIDNTKLGQNEVAYTVTGTMENLSSFFVSKVVAMTTPTSTTISPVTLSFKRAHTNVVVGIYETVPGYSVVDINFYPVVSGEATPSTTNPYLISSGTNSFYGPSASVTAKVTYSAVTDEAEPVVVYDGTKDQSYLTCGAINTGNGIGTSSVEATFAKAVAVEPTVTATNSEVTAGDLTLRVSYTLKADDGDETIQVKDALAVIPSTYTKWEANHIYTYIFKITNATSNLYPITFDAVVDLDEDDYKETITTVTTNNEDSAGYSITTYQDGTNGQDEYYAGKAIDVTVMATGTGSVDYNNLTLYTATADPTTLITESNCINAYIAGPDSSRTTPETYSFNGVTLTESSLLETSGSIKAFTPSGEGYYVLIYDFSGETEAAIDNVTCKVVKVGAAPEEEEE